MSTCTEKVKAYIHTSSLDSKSEESFLPASNANERRNRRLRKPRFVFADDLKKRDRIFTINIRKWQAPGWRLMHLWNNPGRRSQENKTFSLFCNYFPHKLLDSDSQPYWRVGLAIESGPHSGCGYRKITDFGAILEQWQFCWLHGHKLFERLTEYCLDWWQIARHLLVSRPTQLI